MAIRTIDDSILQGIAEAIQAKDGGGKMYDTEMRGRIEAIPLPVEKKDVNFYDWEGTLLFGYSVEEVQAMTSLPAPDTSPNYQTVDHDLLTFQEWNWGLANIKAWIQTHEGRTLDVDAIYTTTDGQDHNFWNSPRLDTIETVSMQKRATASIGNDAFQYCRSLTQINIPNGVTRIGDNAFHSCVSLTQINIPNGVTRIGSYAFYSCRSLTRINIPDSVTSIGDLVFQDCYSLTRINIPNSVTRIGDYAFYNCYSLTQVNIPDGVTSIGNYAFQGCVSLTQVNIPNGVTSIENYAFPYCRSLTQVNIPDGVTRIGDGAFYNCNSLCDVLLESKPTLTNTNAFSDLPANYRIYVPRSYLSWFETETNWSSIYTAHIVAIEDYIEYLESLGFDVDKYKEAA